MGSTYRSMVSKPSPAHSSVSSSRRRSQQCPRTPRRRAILRVVQILYVFVIFIFAIVIGVSNSCNDEIQCDPLAITHLGVCSGLAESPFSEWCDSFKDLAFLISLGCNARYFDTGRRFVSVKLTLKR